MGRLLKYSKINILCLLLLGIVLIAGTYLLTTNKARANGGGFWIQSPTWGVGNPVFRDIPEVSILSERLHIKLGHSHSDIKVKYVLWNHSDVDFMNIDYAFPVDFANGSYEDDETYTESWQVASVKYIEFVAGGKVLTHSSKPATLLETLDPENNDKYKMYGWPLAHVNELYRRWYYTQISIPRKSFLTLEVNYSVNSPYYGDGDAPYEYDGGETNVLNYDFSPAAHWGNGIIGDFYVQLDASELEFSGMKTTVKTIEPKADDDGEYTIFGRYSYRNWDANSNEDTIYVNGLAFEGNGPVYTCRIRNFDLTKSRPLHIYYYHPSSLSTLLDSYIPQDEYRVKASSGQKDYPVANLVDMNPSTAWVPAHKGGIGDWVEFDFTKKDTLERVVSLFLVNGYCKDQTTYEQNNRVKRLQVMITSHPDEVGEMYTDTMYVTLPDARYQPVSISTVPYYSTYLEQERYGSKIANGFAPVFDLFLSEIPVKTIRLTIMDVYKGTKYDDTCLSEILLFRYGTYDRYLPAFYDRYRRK